MTYYKGLIDKYRKYLPVNEFTPIVTLNEGNTPLIKADNLAKKLELDAEIYLKFEGSNPTGSFKDRGMTMAVTKLPNATIIASCFPSQSRIVFSILPFIINWLAVQHFPILHSSRKIAHFV